MDKRAFLMNLGLAIIILSIMLLALENLYSGIGIIAGTGIMLMSIFTTSERCNNGR